MRLSISVRSDDEAIRREYIAQPWREVLGEDAELRVSLDPAWDGATDAFLHACESGAHEAMPGANVYEQGAVWHLARSLDIFRIFETADLGVKVVKVWRIGPNLGPFVRALDAVFHPQVLRVPGSFSCPWREQLDVIEVEGGVRSTLLDEWAYEYGVAIEYLP